MSKPLYAVVNRYIVTRNARAGQNEPPLRVSRGKHGTPQYGHEFEWLRPARVRLVYRPGEPLPCGARVWLVIEDEDG